MSISIYKKLWEKKTHPRKGVLNYYWELVNIALELDCQTEIHYLENGNEEFIKQTSVRLLFS